MRKDHPESQPPLTPLNPPHTIDSQERDACALICAVRKGGQATHGNVKRTIEGLARMGHRSGYVDGEGDGVGILTDIPRQLWSKRLSLAGLRSSLATDRSFWVAHVMIGAAEREQGAQIIEYIIHEITVAGLHVLIDQPAQVNRTVLGPNAARNEPAQFQVVGLNGQVAPAHLERTLFELQLSLERKYGVHFASFSARSVVYKVQGTVEILRRYYPELRDPDYASTVTLGHARYSTNTNPIFERAQPFGLLGHNGEFNTISRLKLEAEMLGIPLDPNNSDSQDVDRLLHGMCLRYGLDLVEAMEYVFPPFEHDLLQTIPEIHQMYREMRQAFGPFAQGPAALAARLGDMVVFSVDALGLRPLWFGETEKEYFATSERGVYPLDSMSTSPKPMAPGEKIALRIRQGHNIEMMDYAAIQRHIFSRYRERAPFRIDVSSGKWQRSTDEIRPLAPAVKMSDFAAGTPTYSASRAVPTPTSEAVLEVSEAPTAVMTAAALPWHRHEQKISIRSMAALGWERYHVEVVDAMVETQKEMVGSLGWDGPLAAISHTRTNLSDYFKEVVAVVTNPAIDLERERAQFSTRVVLGVRPLVGQTANTEDLLIELDTPFLLGGHPDLGSLEDHQVIASRFGSMTLEDLVTLFGERAVVLSMSAAFDETIDDALARMRADAVEAVQSGARLIILDDSPVYSGQQLWIDPNLATAAVDRALRESDNGEISLRRLTGLVVRSGALRDMHDLALCISMGANAVLPYALYAVALGIAPRGAKDPLTSDVVIKRLGMTIKVLSSSILKITSTIGCHELRGYGHSFGGIGLSDEVAAVFGMPSYFGSTERGLGWDGIKADAETRAAELRGELKNKLENPDRFYPKMWKKAEDVAHGTVTLEEYTEALFKLEHNQPVAIRHVLGLKAGETPVDPASVDISHSDYAMPVVIGAMSFGSQGELAYKAYAEAAYRLNIICVNGEGGELGDVMGQYPRNRGQQVASGRFGVNIEFLNSCNLIEIKIGQGAKPGEGGQLPGYKVTEQVAAARKTVPGVALISPSNNHDLYSIEDLAQLIDELKTANARARVSVKIPVVPGVGIIAVGVAKAGADIINITGYEGGTGAARAHSLRHVGLPAELGVWLAHHALIRSGLRDEVELWCDGGMKSGRDVVKMMCLGADRVGFGTLAMVAVGCTICRGCHEGTCHVGITTHIKTKEEAAEKGLKSFEPRNYEMAVQGICNVFEMLGQDIRLWTAHLGITRTRDLVGRTDLLEQVGMCDRIDLSALLAPAPTAPRKHAQPGGIRLTRPRNTLSKQITAIIAEYVEKGDREMTYDDEQVMAMDRALGTHLAGALKRGEIENASAIEAIHLSFSNSAIPGNGLAAFLDAPLNVFVEGGAQDGVAKCARGGTVTILKGLNHNGERLDGSVGKSFAYGAQGGLFIVQGDADTRACIRLSGADVIFGGEIEKPLRDEDGALGSRANLKGYAFEYMTSGRALVLGDPGPWMCAGMTGGVIYQRVQPEMGLTLEAVRRRIAPGAAVDIFPLDERGMSDVRELMHTYLHTLEINNQADAARHLKVLRERPQDYFVKICTPTRSN